MGIKKFFNKIWGTKQQEPDLTPEYIESLPSVDDITFYRDSRRLLQRFDEYITAAETEVEVLSIELDGCLEQQTSLETQLRHLNKPNSWHERHLLLKLDRLKLHCNNLKQRIEIYSQNIKIYLNLISKIQDIKAMKMNGLDEPKMEVIWLDFKETLEQYKNRLMTEEAATDSEGVTIQNLEQRLTALKKEIIPQSSTPEKIEDVKSEIKIEIKDVRAPLVPQPEVAQERIEDKRMVME